MNEQDSIHHRKSIRLNEYDYSRPGAYFITICTFGRKSIFGNIVNGEMVLNQSGRIVLECWKEMGNHFSNIEIDYYILMPNHLHGIIFINSDNKGLMNQTPTHHSNGWIMMKNSQLALGKIDHYFKARTSRLLREAGLRNFKWQRLYNDHIIRNNRSLDKIRQYIIYNPIKWELDKDNPQNWQGKLM